MTKEQRIIFYLHDEYGEGNENVKIVINALEKRIPYKCGSIIGKCKCGKAVYPHMKCCSDCGQALDWSDK